MAAATMVYWLPELYTSAPPRVTTTLYAPPPVAGLVSPAEAGITTTTSSLVLAMKTLLIATPLSFTADIDQPVRVALPWVMLNPGVVSLALKVVGTMVRSTPLAGRKESVRLRPPLTGTKRISYCAALPAVLGVTLTLPRAYASAGRGRTQVPASATSSSAASHRANSQRTRPDLFPDMARIVHTSPCTGESRRAGGALGSR